MDRTSITLLFCLLMVSVHGLSNQNRDLGTNSSERTVRIEDRQSRQIPDGLVFLQTLQRLGRLGFPDNGSATELVQTEMGLDQNDANDFVYLMISTSRFVRYDTDGVEERIGCESGVPRVNGDEVYRILDAINDEKIKIAARHLQLLKRHIGPEQTTSLQQWLDRQKPENSNWKIDYKEHFDRRGLGPDAILARICNTDANHH